MMVRRLSLIVPILSAVVAVSNASAQPRQEVGPWDAMERVGESLQTQQVRRGELVEKIEEHYPVFYARNAERLQPGEAILLTPLKLGDGVSTIEYFGPVSSASSATPAPPSTSGASSGAAIVPHEPLVLGSFFTPDGELGSFFSQNVRSLKNLRIAPVAPTPTSSSIEPPAPRPAPTASSTPPPPPPAPEPPAPSASSVSPPPEPAPEPPPTSTPSGTISDASSRVADAYLNFSEGPFPAENSLTTGSPDAWYRSPVVTDLLGRSPNEAEKEDFKSEVLSKVEESFRKSGLDVDLIDEPGPAAHTLSVVSGALAVDNPEAIGIADISGDGFTFIDNFVSNAIQSMEDLETAVANNIAHELMHAFGVDYHDESGNFIDSGRIPWDLLASDDLSFSDEAVQLLSSVDFQRRWDDFRLASAQVVEHGNGCSCHPNGPLATPEPASLAVWGLTLFGVAWSGYRYRQAAA